MTNTNPAPEADPAATIAALNDQMRRNILSPAPNIVVMTKGVLAVADADAETDPAAALARHVELMAIIANFTDFSEGNDPHAERDFASFEWQGVRCFWKIDYYDRATEYGSPDPADPKVTCRVLTIMRADEY